MAQQEWTIMVYMAGDNNLSVDMAYAMQQIKDVAGADTKNVNLFVYYDGSAETIPTLYCDFSDSENPRHVRSHKVKDKLVSVRTKPNENAADYRSVANFVDWCVNKVEREENGVIVKGRQAKRYALIFSGHSMGFQDIGLFKDESAEKAMNMQQLHDLLERLTKSEEELKAEEGEQNSDFVNFGTTEIIGQKFDILGFDSCVMGMLEVGNQFGGVAKTMIASEGSVPNAGWTYAKILGNLVHVSEDTPVTEIAADFVREFVHTQDSYTIGGVSVDMAAWDFSQLPNLNAAFEGLADALIDCFDDPNSTIYKQIERVLLQVHWKCQSYMYDQNVDLGDMCELLYKECGSLKKEVGGEILPFLEKIERSCVKVARELTNTVILSGFSGGMYQYSNGISLFWPWSRAGYEVSMENYAGLKFVTETPAGQKWNEFLEKYVGEVTYRESEEPKEDTEGFGIHLESAPHVEDADVLAYSMPDSKQRYYSYHWDDSGNPGVVNAETEGRVGGASGTKMGGASGTKLGGADGTKMGGADGTKMGGASGTKMGGADGTKMGGASGTKMGGADGTKMGGASGTKMGGASGTKMGGADGTKMGGASGTKMGGADGTKMGGASGTKMGGADGTKMGGASGTKMGGADGTKMGGASGTKMGGASGTKMGGASGTKMGGASGTKLAGGGGGASDKFFNSLKGFKNVEEEWNISGFTKKQPKPADGLKSKKTSSG